MNERLVTFDFVDGEGGVSLGDNYRYFTAPCNLTVIYVSVSPSVDDAALTIDINDDGTGVITAVAAAAAAVPGTWKSTHMRGANAPVSIAAGSVISLDANGITSGTRVGVSIWALAGEVFA